MRKMTRKFLNDAFAGESMAHMKYAIFAEEAEKRGKKNLAKLFRAISYAEFVHAQNVSIPKKTWDEEYLCLLDSRRIHRAD